MTDKFTIINRSDNFKCAACWRVWGSPGEAEECFDRCTLQKNCTHVECSYALDPSTCCEDAELRFLVTCKLCKASLASPYIPEVFWGELGEICHAYLKKEKGF